MFACVWGVLSVAATCAAGPSAEAVTLVKGICDRDARLTRLAWEGMDERHQDPTVRGGSLGGRPIERMSQLWARCGDRAATAWVEAPEHAADTGINHLSSPAMLDAWSVVSVSCPSYRLEVQPSAEQARVAEGRTDSLWERRGWDLGALVERQGLSAPRQVVECQSDAVDGLACRRLSFDRSRGPSVPTYPRSVWVAPALGYAVVREEERFTDGKLANRKSRTGFARYVTQRGEEVWLPSRVSWVFCAGEPENRGRRLAWGTLEVAGYRFDVGPQDLFLGLTLDDVPPDYVIVDSRANVAYRRGPVDGQDPAIREGAERLRAFARHLDVGRLKREWEGRSPLSQHPGPQALLMLCAMRGVDASTSELAKLAGADVRGTPMSGLLAAARAKGFEAALAPVAVTDLGSAKLPAIVEERPNNYLVIVGVVEDKVVLVRPPGRLEVNSVSSWSRRTQAPITLLTLGKGPPGSREVRWGSRWMAGVRRKVASLGRMPLARQGILVCLVVAILAASTGLILMLRQHRRTGRATSAVEPSEAKGPEPDP